MKPLRSSIPNPLPPFELDLIMAARYAYYVQKTPFMSDKDYDETEAEYRMIYGDDLPVGSEKPSDYTPAQRALALYFCLSGRATS